MEDNVRPWGRYDILDEGKYHKVKRITVNPGQRLSYQSHKQREEVWTIVEGIAIVTQNGDIKAYLPGDVVKIPKGMKHRVANTTIDNPLVFIEVQLGEYLGEDDITRYEDDYQRT